MGKRLWAVSVSLLISGCSALDNGVRVETVDSAAEWSELQEVIAVAHDELTARYGRDVADRTLSFTLRIFPADAPVTPKFSPSEDKRKLDGLCETTLNGRVVISVRYREDIYASALFHEIIEHRLVYVLSRGADANPDHSPDWYSKMLEIRAAVHADLNPPETTVIVAN